MSAYRIAANISPDPTPKRKPAKSGQFIQLPPLAMLMETFDLDPSTPEGLRWKRRPRCHFQHDLGFKFFDAKYPGTPAGGVSGKYYRVSVTYYVKGEWISANLHNHRIIWAISNGRDPGANIVDHSNLDKNDNGEANLRLADHVQSSQNRGRRSDNLSGVVGVAYRPDSKKWRARITVSKNVVDLGSFDTLEEAAVVRQAAEKKYFGEFSPIGGK